MHIPDGFLSGHTAAASGAIAVASLGMALWAIRRNMNSSRVSLVAVAAAFVFAGQMLNFPVAGGTSGHLIGATLIAILLGPSAAVVAIALVLLLQCLLFADGGVTALGANIFNMAIVGTFAGYGVYAFVRKMIGEGPWVRLVATALGAFCSTVAASIVCAGQLALSGASPWATVLPAMAGVHVFIGIGEAIITTVVVALAFRTSPELDNAGPIGTSARFRELVAYGTLAALGMVAFVAPFASAWPDGLEKVASVLGFEHRALDPLLASPLPDYALPGVGHAALSTILAGVIGTLAVLSVTWMLARVVALMAAKPRLS